MPTNFDLKNLARRYAALPPQKRSLILLVSSLSFAMIGFLLGFAIITRSMESSPTEESDVTLKPTVNRKSIFGKIVPLEASLYMEGTHRLVDDDGNTLILLSAKDDKLKLSEGMKVQVSGVVRKTLEGDAEIMAVELIKFK
ncbi:hypothetical protein COY33_01680 [candidate division WWE3 bacterium CG_4_10_14_0_2_um_filter_42_7]|uniref:Uncharacterized protein n=1 Tax=candidate division WWE3 bacterium CG_4_10_14_0_2_um_filter_42_7 TaxID=1975073 RepID=A0A2M7TD71_UNCKA|nr:MAG: hypothetical protein COY33_01680 [candidate division WWE3 bacterium CG_4_10_14_0_2_um_filter_42_7]